MNLLKRIFVFIIAVVIAVSCCVLCPSADSATFVPVITYSQGDASISNLPPAYDCLGSDNLLNLAFTPDFYLLYDCDRTSYFNSPNFVEVEVSFYADEDMSEPIIVDSTFSISFAYCITYDDTITISESGAISVALWSDVMAWDPEWAEGFYAVEYYTETVDEFSGRTVRHCNYELVCNQDVAMELWGINVLLMLPTFVPGNSVGYTEAVVPMTYFHIDPLGLGGGLITPPEVSEDVSDDVSGGGSGEVSGGDGGSNDSSATVEKLEEIYSAITETGATVANIYNSLVDVSPDMQESINHLDTLLTDEKENINEIVGEMENIDTDFNTQINDFNDVLNDNADSLSGMGSTTYSSFVNDVFGHWFFVTMFALFGAFAFFSRAVFG